jgi:hypothetical protein
VSWLLAAFIPALLMLATFGLQRLESSLEDDTVSASDVAEFLDQAEADDVDTLAREGMGRALDGLHQRLGERERVRDGGTAVRETTSLPNGLNVHHSVES